jgi:transposase|nr:MAG TPA: transposase [Caudoviricetes sp.]
MEKKRNYTKEFKVQACELVLKENLKVKTVAERMGINHIMLYRWIDDYRTYGEEAFVGKGNLRAEAAKIKKLERENEELRQQVGILKKAAAYFAKGNKNG